jgi:hypothetical protein
MVAPDNHNDFPAVEDKLNWNFELDRLSQRIECLDLFGENSYPTGARSGSTELRWKKNSLPGGIKEEC